MLPVVPDQSALAVGKTSEAEYRFAQVVGVEVVLA